MLLGLLLLLFSLGVVVPAVVVVAAIGVQGGLVVQLAVTKWA